MSCDGSKCPPSKVKYFGVYVPQEDSVSSGDKSCVVTSFKELQVILKRNPRSRFKPANSEEEAYFLANDSGDTAVIGTAEAGDITSPEKEIIVKTTPKGRKGRLSLSALDSISKPQNKPEGEVKRLVGEEKDTRFPTPKVQELCLMAREISTNKTAAVIAKVKANPRLLITESDLPTTVQEGCRYNALHVAAKCNNSEAIAFIIDTVSSIQYMQNLYPKDNMEIIKDRIKQVVNCYLNTPDKMANETPLHFACKFLAVEAVEVLVSHPDCVLEAKNLYGEIPASIVGSRADSKSKDFKEKKDTIIKLLTEIYIVPIWRDPTGFLHPVVGEVSSLKKLGNRIPKHLLHHFPTLEISNLGVCDRRLYPRERYNSGPGAVFEDEVFWEIKAYGGPTTQELASCLHADLRLTSGRGYLTSGQPAPPPVIYDSSNRPIVAKDRNSYSVNEAFNSSPPSSPSRGFPGSPPISPYAYSPMVNYLKAVGSPVSPGPREILMRRVDPEKGLERIARKFSLQLGINWSEEWAFLNFFGDILSEKGLDLLESYFIKVEATSKEAKRTPRILGTAIGHHLFDEGKGLENLRLDSWGYPTPTKIPQCNNRECRMPGRFCTCKNVAPTLYFSQKPHSSPEESFSSNGDFDNSGDFDVTVYKDGFSKQTGTNNVLGIAHIDELPRATRNSFNSTDTEDTSQKLSDFSRSFYGEEEDGRWFTPASSPVGSPISDLDFFFDCSDDSIFLNGSEPCKQDYQLYNLVKEEEDKLADVSHLLVFQWFNTMKSLGNRETKFNNTGATPLRSDFRLNSRMDQEFTPFHSTPKKLMF